jgi:type II secretory pathway pseudopilin PulG
MRAGSTRAPRQGGFTFVTLLVTVALLGIGLAALGPFWSAQAQRDNERELLRVGALYAQAIAAYRDSAPGSLKRYPPDLASLLVDTRFVGVRRHLRKLYADPLEPARPWGLVMAADGGVRGVYSLDERMPFANVARDLIVTSLPAAQHYADWKFIAKEAP